MDASQATTPHAPTADESETDKTQTQDANLDPPAQPEDVTQTTKPPKKSRGPSKVAPSAERPPGKSLLPLTRVQKILRADKELPSCSREAVLLISVAAEEFIKRLGEAGQQQAMREKRTTIQRKDIAAAVRRADEFVFLEEILSSGVVAPPPQPAKRKQKVPGTAADSMNIKDAFGKKASANPSIEEPEISQHGDGNAMDVS